MFGFGFRLSLGLWLCRRLCLSAFGWCSLWRRCGGRRSSGWLGRTGRHLLFSVRQAGANVLVAGSAIYGAEDVAEAIKKIRG